MTKTLNVAMIGGGFMGKAHALAYATMPMFFWPAPAIPVRKVVVDITEALADGGRRRYGFEESSADWRSVVTRSDIDVIDIVTPNDSHAAIAIAAAEAGKHIICEKPLARGGDEAKTMLDAVNKAGVIHMVAFNYRRTPAVALARQYIEEGRIGKILNFRGTYLQDWSADPDSPLSWRFQRKIAGSGSIGDIGTHVVDLARYLVGEIAEVSALVRTYNKTRPIQRGNLDRLGAAERNTDTERAEVDVDDEVMTLLKFADGAIGSLEATRNAYGRNNFITFEIHGTKGSIAFNYERRDELQVMFADDPADARGFRSVYSGPAHPYGSGLWPIPALGIGYSETKIVECFDFFSAIVSGKQPLPNFEDGYKTERVADALIESGQSGQWTKVRP
ncbi:MULTISPECIES: Gfo/Idh/MocA family oxidoreductase [unclassified Mesorhizobium]|uniref:Gfo/Idh/MocA family protein n=1 Tax=unclassified Mesorhizobium TaxID=325217 RepID=UPI00112E8C32|nr:MULTISPECIES: Gfo/Idh/MocA family oxidoreductase [unclassified Mesorhizobium]MBZ9918869.1 Gfo/Idh/MocA family oxidoreductase [Mesorhizobium sp. BR1-1-7]MBZ9954013.1 Gfo/Idh/MocA family oxidoreductase [Mesorhizobium sp. BR1-1-15]MBZ9970698.1 Gfo/Idh/MocA family oxidoreductase [Mesorhizobium sp. BR1-1-12]MBZ9970803.1 Gfo/Idh/MocA family oxidoreductase [Mesorhizobium sp. BR1-1-12]TPM05159.1 Gfo/Idh/MocA family oxidoreductase [Mesorhizobium sp. B2-3-8]